MKTRAGLCVESPAGVGIDGEQALFTPGVQRATGFCPGLETDTTMVQSADRIGREHEGVADWCHAGVSGQSAKSKAHSHCVNAIQAVNAFDDRVLAQDVGTEVQCSAKPVWAIERVSLVKGIASRIRMIAA